MNKEKHVCLKYINKTHAIKNKKVKIFISGL